MKTSSLFVLTLAIAAIFMSFSAPETPNYENRVASGYAVLKMSKSGRSYQVVSVIRSKPSRLKMGYKLVPVTVSTNGQGIKIVFKTRERLGSGSLSISSNTSKMANNLKSMAGIDRLVPVKVGRINFRNGVGIVPLEPEGWIRDSMFLKKN